jgi:hypothetical protein
MHLTYGMRVFSDKQFWGVGRSSYEPGYERAGFPFIIEKAMLVAVLCYTSLSLPKLFHLKRNEKEMKRMASLFMQHLLKDHHCAYQQNN